MATKKKPVEATEQSTDSTPEQKQIDNIWAQWNPTEMNDIAEQNLKVWMNYWTGVMNSFWGTGKK